MLVDPVCMTVQEVQDALRVSRSTVYRLLDSGELESIKIGSNLRIITESVTSYVEKLRETRG